jgi:hypothetical protein
LSSCLLSENVKIRIHSINFARGFVWEKHRLRVFENRVLRRIFGPKRDEIIGGWRKLHNEELRDLCSSLIN